MSFTSRPRVLVPTVSIAVFLFMLLPIVIVVPMSFSAATSLRFPPTEFSLRWYEAFFSSSIWLTATVTSLVLASIVSSIGLVIGTIAAYALERGKLPGARIVEANFFAPLIVPAVITAVALYIVFARLGVLGTFGGLIVGHLVLVVPYVIQIMQLAIASFDLRIEQVCYTLGASRWQMLVRVMLPNLLPSAIAAWIFSFITSFDEVVLVSFLSGNYVTIPKRMFAELSLQINPVITAVATMLILFNVLLLVAVLLLTRRSRKLII